MEGNFEFQLVSILILLFGDIIVVSYAYNTVSICILQAKLLKDIINKEGAKY